MLWIFQEIRRGASEWHQWELETKREAKMKKELKRQRKGTKPKFENLLDNVPMHLRESQSTVFDNASRVSIAPSLQTTAAYREPSTPPFPLTCSIYYEGSCNGSCGTESDPSRVDSGHISSDPGEGKYCGCHHSIDSWCRQNGCTTSTGLLIDHSLGMSRMEDRKCHNSELEGYTRRIRQRGSRAETVQSRDWISGRKLQPQVIPEFEHLLQSSEAAVEGTVTEFCPTEVYQSIHPETCFESKPERCLKAPKPKLSRYARQNSAQFSIGSSQSSLNRRWHDARSMVTSSTAKSKQMCSHVIDDSNRPSSPASYHHNPQTSQYVSNKDILWTQGAALSFCGNPTQQWKHQTWDGNMHLQCQQQQKQQIDQNYNQYGQTSNINTRLPTNNYSHRQQKDTSSFGSTHNLPNYLSTPRNSQPLITSPTVPSRRQHLPAIVLSNRHLYRDGPTLPISEEDLHTSYSLTANHFGERIGMHYAALRRSHTSPNPQDTLKSPKPTSIRSTENMHSSRNSKRNSRRYSRTPPPPVPPVQAMHGSSAAAAYAYAQAYPSAYAYSQVYPSTANMQNRNSKIMTRTPLATIPQAHAVGAEREENLFSNLEKEIGKPRERRKAPPGVKYDESKWPYNQEYLTPGMLQYAHMDFEAKQKIAEREMEMERRRSLENEKARRIQEETARRLMMSGAQVGGGGKARGKASVVSIREVRSEDGFDDVQRMGRSQSAKKSRSPMSVLKRFWIG